MHFRLPRPALETLGTVALAAGPLISASVAAQDTTGDPSAAQTDGWYPVAERPDATPVVRIEVESTGQVVSFDNADLLAPDESTQQAIQDTDDRTTWGDSWLQVTAFASPVEALRMDATLGVGTTWGSAFGRSAAIDLAAASVDADLVQTDGFRLSARAGRQRFEIGGAPKDYFLHGMVDGFTVETEIVDVLTLRVLAFDLFTPQPFPEERHLLFWDRPQGELPSGQRGETNTYRTGAVLQTVDQLVDGLDLRAFFFHASVGGSGRDFGSGSDISEGGLVGNFRDRDYVQMLGFRGGYSADVSDAVSVGGFAEFARSDGIDRKELTSIDVDLQGIALGLGADLDVAVGNARFGLAADWHRMEGAEYSVNGLEFGRGFVSMFGDPVGGLASASIAGMRPSAVVDRYGVLHNPDDVDRSAGTDFTHVALQLGWRDTSLEAQFWTYADTRTSGFDQRTIDTVEVPPEHSREEFAAQRRAGLALGNEIDLTLRQVVHDYAAFFARAGVFVPGDYYAVEVSRVASPEAIEGNYRLGGEDTTFWAVAAGAEFGFGYRRDR